ncbi:Pr6Pr family membrane protein [Blastococcus sp. LR1]|uniref:Pr6Pr family membrane protein n=1 Tax=Blastococcus sp. LR1 TaxID=2877000 RepID=UPI001CCF7D65|nr:Pr6Pr family membrane protein [Blastococcus sp. LR1]MCA0143694.1 Pr6Pr family membrane protein [Blastococcus sp. LR1]
MTGTTPAVDRAPTARLWWAALAAVVAVSVGTEFVLHLVDPEDASLGVVERVVRFFSYFTVQSNLLVLAAVIPLVRNPLHDGPVWRVVRLASLLGITITGIVYAVVLAPLYDPEGLKAWTNAGEHYVSPVMAVLGWLLFGPRPRITTAVVGRALLWPVAWIAWILAQGTVTDWYPYDFMDVAAHGYAVALRNLAFVVLLALAFLLLFRFVDRRLPATDAPEPLVHAG